MISFIEKWNGMTDERYVCKSQSFFTWTFRLLVTHVDESICMKSQPLTCQIPSCVTTNEISVWFIIYQYYLWAEYFFDKQVVRWIYLGCRKDFLPYYFTHKTFTKFLYRCYYCLMTQSNKLSSFGIEYLNMYAIQINKKVLYSLQSSREREPSIQFRGIYEI